jgi:hypothetical protein
MLVYSANRFAEFASCRSRPLEYGLAVAVRSERIQSRSAVPALPTIAGSGNAWARPGKQQTPSANRPFSGLPSWAVSLNSEYLIIEGTSALPAY